MKRISSLKGLICSFLLIAFLGLSFQAISQTGYSLSNDKKMIVNGTSNAHDWDMQVNNWDLSGQFVFDGNELKDINNLNVEVTVASLESGKNVMNKKTYEALEEESNPAISFKLQDVKKMQKVGERYAVTASGLLNIAGKSEVTDIFVVLNMESDGSIKFNGNKTIDMTEWGIAPPTAMLGAMKVGPSVTVSFNGTLQKTMN